MTATLSPLVWKTDHLLVLDQRRLPAEEQWLTCRNAGDVAEAIRSMVVRGAPAIGIAAAYGIALAARQQPAADLTVDFDRLAASRPTAVNLFWALARMRDCLQAGADADRLAAEACAIHAEDLAQNRQLAGHGAALLPADSAVLTHCNTGALATGGHGTALGVIRTAWSQGKITRVYATETRPWLQGARLTAWELARDGIPVSLLVDSAAASVMAREKPAWIIVGADRIAVNGDVVNKIGTYALAVLAQAHKIPFMVAAPMATVDPALADGAAIPIEERPPDELWQGYGPQPAGLAIHNPVFDLTPAALISAIVTERGVVRPAAGENMHKLIRND